MLGCATNQDSLLLATLRYVNYHSGLINKNYSLDLSSIDCSEMKENYKLQFDDHFRAFVGNSMIISCKTEIQMVILRCSTGLTLDCIKSYDSKCKYFHFCFFVILQKKNSFLFFEFLDFFGFCVITVVPIMIQLFSTSK